MIFSLQFENTDRLLLFSQLFFPIVFWEHLQPGDKIEGVKVKEILLVIMNLEPIFPFVPFGLQDLRSFLFLLVT